ncbi:AAA+ superfamily ATPase [Mannheimia sp. USDA-ARS-USMARC-1261]|uniref:ATP-binding protein n=1 Tax=Mannheimia sp. USDA-ARS-USMARC-1261 TaxID=1432056 RepID=UPI0003E327D3|nr:ATP-binding protein [Mannheimia sp. USDA-ARS-USMARC-1261]AHG73732.1 AAA+ superfamily ATPase [Mannheimia sp. USDA-ARS-USMARC-1261]
MISRQMQSLVTRLVKQFPAILVTGARQVGKSTLLQHIGQDYQYITFDDPMLLQQAKDESRLFFLNHQGKLILDEVQYVPEIFSLLKLEIDRKQQNGLFLLSGSQAFELMQNVSETLAGRIAILKLQGLSLREILGVSFNQPFVPNSDYLLAREQELKQPENIWQLIHKGDMPRLYAQETDWEIYYRSYVATYIERDVRQLTNIASTTDFTRFMVSIASRSGELLNYSNIAQEVGVSNETIKRWVAILQTSGIIYLLQPYHNNHLKRAIKTPKVYFLDTGLMAYLTKWLTPETISSGAKSGQFFETFVVSQVIKSFNNQGIEPPLYFYRDTNQKEIDLIIEYNRTLYPVEIKVTASPNKKMAKSFDLLSPLSPEWTLGQGVIINQYPTKLYLSENLVALPLSYL